MESFSQFPATLTLIGANVLASLYAFSNPAFLIGNLFDVGAIRQRREWHRLITSGFLHGGLFHLLINMFVLFQFGQFIESWIGTAKFVIVYFAALLGGNLWALLENFRKPDYRALGASGATSGIILAFCLFEPFRMLYVIVFPMPAVVFAILFIVVSAMLAQRENKVIGHEAHIGGGIAGLLATIALEPQALAVFAEQISAVLGGS
ncbi:rhomboid family intramembrane serine protease [Henriciella aquimarina]|uniref:rhomboid family intramembrane serine protease n=1 Tax=Henriciella aquimarina TaxID=545261 RepID=UPI000A011EA3|nr:rhomboid family intramembrane serine protease [Henriciella aquimarina]